MAKQKKEIVTKDGAGISVPYTTTSTSNPQSNYTPSQTTDSPTSVMYWPNMNTWQTQGKDAAKKAYYEYLNALNEYQNTPPEQSERKLQAAGKMNSLIQSMVQGVQIATEAVENINKRIRQGDSTAKFDLDTVVDIVKKMLKTIWVHNTAARQGKHTGLEIKPLESQLVGRINRVTNLVADDFGVPIANADEANLIWLDTTYPPQLPEPIEQPIEEETQDPETEALSPEEQDQADQEQLQQTNQEPPPEEELSEGNVEGEPQIATPEMLQQEAPTEEENEEIPDELLNQYSSGEIPEGSEEELSPKEEAQTEEQPIDEITDEEIPIEEEQQQEEIAPTEEEVAQEEEKPVEENIVTEEDQPSEIPTDEEVDTEAQPTEEEIEGDDHTQESPDDITTPEEEATEESQEAVDADDEAAQQEEEASAAQDEADQQADEAAVAEDKADEEAGEADQEISESERGKEDKTDDEDIKYCIECDRDTNSEDRATCENEKCPFKTKEKNTTEEVSEEAQKHFALFCHEDHSQCNTQRFTVKEYTGVEGVYCLTHHKLVEYNFNQKEWDSESVRNWIQKQFKTKEKTDEEIAKEVVQEELPDAILKAWIEKEDNIQKKDEEDFEIEDIDANTFLSNISKVMDEAFSPLNERLTNLGV